MLKAYAVIVGMAFLLTTPTWAQQGSGGNTLYLVCSGQGQKPDSRSTNTLEWDKRDQKYRTRSGTEYGTKDYTSSVTVQLYGDSGRIRLPSVMIPPIHSGGDQQGWWQLRDVIVGNNEIRASYNLNGLNTAKLRIDRQTGDIRIKSLAADFSGSCSRSDPNERRF